MVKEQKTLDAFWGPAWASKSQKTITHLFTTQERLATGQARLSTTGKLLRYKPLVARPHVPPTQNFFPCEIWRYIFRLAIDMADEECRREDRGQRADTLTSEEESDFRRDRAVSLPTTPAYEALRFRDYQIHRDIVDPGWEKIRNDDEYKSWLKSFSWIRRLPTTQAKDISQVCRLWRQILLQERAFWTKLCLSFDRDANKIGRQAVEQCFSRAGNLPVKVLWVARDMDELPPIQTLQACHERCQRVQSLTIRLNGSNAHPLGFPKGLHQLFVSWMDELEESSAHTFTQMDTLDVEVSHLPNELPCFSLLKYLNFIPFYSPSMRKLAWKLEGGFPRLFVGRPFTNLLGPHPYTSKLTHIDICPIASAGALFLLLSSPMLVQCSLTVVNLFHASAYGSMPEESRTLHHLEKLEVSVLLGEFPEEIFHALICPALKTLSFRDTEIDLSDTTIGHQLESFLSASACPLESLELQGFPTLTGADVARILKIPSISDSLRQFRLARLRSLLPEPQALVDSLTAPCIGRDIVYAPHLTSLELCCRVFPIRQGSLTSMVLSRLDGRQVAGGCCQRLRSFAMFGSCNKCRLKGPAEEQEIKLLSSQIKLSFVKCHSS